MNSLEDLLNRPGDQLTLEMVQGLVADRIQEGFTLDYKRELGGIDSTLRTVTAMANTFGGVILVGVDEDRTDGALGYPGSDGIVGVEPKERGRLVSKCYSLLVPPYSPEVVSVDVGEGRVVLVVRVDTRVAQRPVMYRNRAYVRTANGNEEADRFRLDELFHEAPTVAGQFATPVPGSPQNHYVWGEDPPADLMVRLSSLFPVVAAGRRLRFADDGKRALVSALRSSPLDPWLVGQLRGSLGVAGDVDVVDWHQEGQNTTTQLQLRWQGCIEHGTWFPEAHCIVEIPGGGTGQMSCILDVIFKQTKIQQYALASGIVGAPKFRLAAVDLLALLRGLLNTFAEAILPVTTQLSGVPTGVPVGPFCFITTHSKPLNESVQLDLLTVVPGNRPGFGAEGLRLDYGTSLDDRKSRTAQASEWMRQMLTDCHFAGVDAFVANLERTLEQAAE